MDASFHRQFASVAQKWRSLQVKSLTIAKVGISSDEETDFWNGRSDTVESSR